MRPIGPDDVAVEEDTIGPNDVAVEEPSSVTSSSFDDKFSTDLQILTKRYLTSRDAYVTGYFFTTIDTVPPGFVSYMSKTYSGGWSEDKIIKAFTSLAVEVALPEETLKTNTMNGRAGFSRTSPLFSQKGSVITVNFLVDQQLESTNLLMGWYDYITKVADGRLEDKDGNPKANVFGSNFYYCTLLPNMRDIVFAFAGEGFYPTSNPLHDFGHTLETYQNLKHASTFNVDYYDYWTYGRMDTYWLKTYMETQIEKYTIMLSAGGGGGEGSGVGDKFSNPNITDDRKLKLRSDEEKPQHYGQFNTDRYGNKTSKNTEDDGSVHDKFQLRNG